LRAVLVDEADPRGLKRPLNARHRLSGSRKFAAGSLDAMKVSDEIHSPGVQYASRNQRNGGSSAGNGNFDADLEAGFSEPCLQKERHA